MPTGSTELKHQDLKAATDLPDGDLQRTLQSLACGKFRVLTKLPKSRDVNPTDKFAFNEAFTCPLAKIKIMQVASKVETTKEREETQEQVDEERKHQIEVSCTEVSYCFDHDSLRGRPALSES